ncbi:YjdF family protein [Paenibacillus caui]|uniref:YjdF family protein n=1 Tax=Paenibacillus caui TaxID=2873927 RepID=UPI001CA81362|nr:YjdF family protein [Paenibacillus caui]
MKLIVYYENPYWVGAVEAEEQGIVKAARHIFGPEPTNPELLAFVQSGEFSRLIEGMNSVVATGAGQIRKISPKRLQREVSKEMKARGIGTFAEQAIKLQYEECKRERKKESREMREALKERKRELARQKAKAKHKGR